jgi:predicted  nucleic acid-binding Zn-ribbon protein
MTPAMRKITSETQASGLASPLFSATVQALKGEKGKLHTQLASAQEEIQHLRQKVSGLEQSLHQSAELAEDQIQQAESNFLARQVRSLNGLMLPRLVIGGI